METPSPHTDADRIKDEHNAAMARASRADPDRVAAIFGRGRLAKPATPEADAPIPTDASIPEPTTVEQAAPIPEQPAQISPYEAHIRRSLNEVLSRDPDGTSASALRLKAAVHRLDAREDDPKAIYDDWMQAGQDHLRGQLRS